MTEPVKALLCLLCLLVTAAAAPGPAGSYRLVGEQDIASGLVLWPEGRFEYFLSGGALDEHSEGRWSAAGGIVTMVTEPKPVPAVFTPSSKGRARDRVLAVSVNSLEGRGIAGVRLRIGFAEGAPLEAYTQEDGWSLPAEEKRKPRWIELALPLYDLRSPRFPIDLAADNALAFTFEPNDLGVVDFAGMKIETVGEALVLHRGSARLRYERVR
jgi:hypothetical protein